MEAAQSGATGPFPSGSSLVGQSLPAHPPPGAPPGPPPEPLPGPPPAGAAPRRRPRNPLLDNIRFLLIVLVVFGHFLTSMRDDPVIETVYLWIYLFHMPAFVFLAGLVITNYALDRRGARRIVTGLLAPFVIFTVLYELFGRWVDMPVPSDDPLRQPYWLLWFLMALALWRVCVPLLSALRWPVVTTVVTSTVLATAIDLSKYWSIDRFVVLMPFFTAGLMLTPDRLARVRTPGWRALGVVVLLLAIPVAVWAKDAQRGFITYSDAVDSVAEMPTFLFFYAVATAMTAAFIALSPGGRSRMSVWGTRTIYVYLLHGFFVRAYRASDWDSALESVQGMFVILLVSIVLSILLASPLAVKLTHHLVEPRLAWLMKDRPVAQDAPGRL